jgi:hypothetical protein
MAALHAICTFNATLYPLRLVNKRLLEGEGEVERRGKLMVSILNLKWMRMGTPALISRGRDNDQRKAVRTFNYTWASMKTNNTECQETGVMAFWLKFPFPNEVSAIEIPRHRINKN